jgi:hypothetical protein
VLERIIENWLTSAGETGYQAAFSQLLSIEGCRVLHAPVHHPFEHGKDTVALAADGELRAYQLKGGDINLTELERLQGQLFALAASAITYPGVEPPRRPDRAYLICSGRLSPPARDRLSAINSANRESGLPPIEVVELDQLVSRFSAAHGAFLPAQLTEFSELLKLALSDGQDCFPTRTYSDVIQTVLQWATGEQSRSEVKRSIGALVIITSYANAPWLQRHNHLGVAESWLVLAFQLLRVAEAHDLAEDVWRPSFELARDSARQALGRLLDEAVGAEDLIVPDLVEGLVHPARAALVCGYCSGLYLCEELIPGGADLAGKLRSLLAREAQQMSVPSEAGTAHILTAATALERLGLPVDAGRMVAALASELATANQPRGSTSLADPYHSFEEVLLHQLGVDSPLDEEDFEGEAYTLHVAVDWMVRRDYREALDRFWPSVARMHFAEFRPSSSCDLLSAHTEDGIHATWQLESPTSWRDLRAEATVLDEQEIPSLAWQHAYLLPFLPLLYPYRLNRSVAKAIDHLATGRCEVRLADGGVAGLEGPQA